MKKTATVLSLFLLILMLTTFNPHNLNFGFHFFKIKKIEVKNLKFLEKKKIENQFLNELSGSSLFILDEKKVNKLLNSNDLISYLENNEIGSMIHYPVPPHKQIAYSEFSSLSLPISEKIHKTTISIPMDPSLDDDSVSIIIDTLNKY